MRFNVGVVLEQEGDEAFNASKISDAMGEVLESLTEYAQSSKYPALVLDKSGYVLFKNKYVYRYVPKLKRGEKIFRFLPEDARFNLEKLEDHKVSRTEISRDDFHCYATVLRIDEFYLVLLDYMAAAIGEAVSESLGNMSGYDIALDIPIGIKGICSFNFGASNELLSEAIDRYKTTQPVPFFKSTDILKALVNELAKKESVVCESIDFEITGDEYISSGSERDFVLAIASMTAFCLSASCDQKVFVEIVGKNGYTDVRVVANSDLSEQGLIDFSRLKNVLEVKNEETGWIYMLKLLSAINLWDFSTNSTLDGRIGFSLRMEVAEDFRDFALRDVERGYLAHIIARVFAKQLGA